MKQQYHLHINTNYKSSYHDEVVRQVYFYQLTSRDCKHIEIKGNFYKKTQLKLKLKTKNTALT